MTSQKDRHLKLQRVEQILINVWESYGIETFNRGGIVFGVTTTVLGGDLDPDTVSLTQMAEDIIAELEL